MKPLIHSLIITASLVALPVSDAGTITILESFEDNVENVTHVTDEEQRRITKFDQSGSSDLDQITEGEKALKVSFEKLRGWQRDFRVLLSPEATATLEGVVEQLSETPEIGRFFLLYDITWDKLDSDAGWANSPLDIGGHGTQAQIEWGGGGKPVMMNYDLGAGLPEGFALNLEGDNGDQTYLEFIFNSNTDLPIDVYVDNIRLLDTKPEGAESLVTVIDSFEESLDSLAPTGNRTEDPEENTDDFYVTHGKKSAQFTLTGNGGWGQDFTIDLSVYEDLLGPILDMDPAERFRYSIAWDWIPEQGEGNAGWFQESVNPGGPGMRVTTGWAGNANMRTRVINLGLVEWDFPPTLTVIHNSNWSGGDMTVYLDNLRLIDTGALEMTPEPFEIASVERKDDGMVALTWPSEEGEVFAVESSSDLQNWEELDDSVQAGGDVTTFTAPSAGKDTYFRVRQ